MALAFPGSKLGSAADFSPGPGTYESNGGVYASILGSVSTKTGTGKATLSVVHFRRRPAATALVPAVGQIAQGRVTRITSTVVNIDILCVSEVVLPQPALGVVRVEDVFPSEVDHTAVQMSSCFRPGDVVKARIMSLGDSRQYYLSTAEVCSELRTTKSFVFFRFVFVVCV